MQKRYTKQAERVLKMAFAFARESGHPYVGTEHLLLALTGEYTSVAGQVLAMNKVDEEAIRKIVDELVSPVGEVIEKKRAVAESPRLLYILENSSEEAGRFRSEDIGTEHMLIAILRDVE